MNIRYLAVLWVAVVAVTGGCGSKTPVSAESDISATTVSKSATGAGLPDVQPCELLDVAQVASVLPDPGAGVVTHSGGSLIAGVDAHQCSYTNAAGDLLTVIVNVAVDDERFEEIRPGSAVRENRERVAAGDEGWMSVVSNEVKIKAVQGRAVIDLELMADEAAGKSSQLAGLAAAVAAKFR